MQVNSEDVERERQDLHWLDKVRYMHPDRVEKDRELPPYIKSRLTSNLITVELRLERTKVRQQD